MPLSGSFLPADTSALPLAQSDGAKISLRRASARPPLPSMRRRRDWTGGYTTRLVLGDLVAGGAAWAVAWAAVDQIGRHAGASAWWAVCGVPVWVVLVLFQRGYERTRLGVGSDELRSVLRASGSALAVAGVVAALLRDVSLLTTVVTAALLAPGFSLLVRLGLRRWLHRRQRSGIDLRETVVVGAMPQVGQLAGKLDADSTLGMRVVGVCVPSQDADAAREAGLEVLADTHDVRGAVLRQQAGAVAVTNGQPAHYLRELAWSLEGLDTQLLVHPGLVEVAGPRMHIRPFTGLPLLAVEQPHFSGWRIVAKRASDIVLSGLALLVFGPLMLALALAVRLEDGGPALFKQTRVGRNNTTFTMYKFRSMHADAEQRLAELVGQNEGAGPLFKMVDDPRITRVGKFLRRTSLDELPQLFNILNGTMSVVGPRPPLPTEVAAYERPVQRRLLVMPGLTGLWQVSGRSSLSWEESVRLDLRYVENWNMALDLFIIWQTAWAVLARRGAY